MPAEVEPGAVEPALTVRPPDGPVRGVALVLHGGRANSQAPVRPGQLAVIRMRPFATALRRVGRSEGLAVARLRYVHRGWNGAAQAPVADVRWALQRLGDRFPDVPVALIGHSMGGRAALYAAGAPAVRVVVGLAPWIEDSDPADQLAGRRLLIMHGDRDRMTDPRASAAYAAAARAVAASVGYVTVRGERHAMLRRAAVWHRLTCGYTLAALDLLAPDATVGGESANIILEALAGSASLTV